MTIQQARKRAEALANAKLDDETFRWILRYAYRKARITGHSPQYVPLLLVDEIKDHVFRQRVNQVSRDYRDILAQLNRKHAGMFPTRVLF